LLVAASGNAGAKSQPLYPAANPNVIAVSGIDEQEKLFAASNGGNCCYGRRRYPLPPFRIPGGGKSCGSR